MHYWARDEHILTDSSIAPELSRLNDFVQHKVNHLDSSDCDAISEFIIGAPDDYWENINGIYANRVLAVSYVCFCASAYTACALRLASGLVGRPQFEPLSTLLHEFRVSAPPCAFDTHFVDDVVNWLADLNNCYPFVAASSMSYEFVLLAAYFSNLSTYPQYENNEIVLICASEFRAFGARQNSRRLELSEDRAASLVAAAFRHLE